MKKFLGLTIARISFLTIVMALIVSFSSRSASAFVKVQASSPSATTSSHHPGFEYHLLSQHTSTLKTTIVPDALPPATCLNLYMLLSNPQTGTVVVYVQVQNFCGTTVSNISLSWDTGGECNGNQYLGPNDVYNVGSLNNSSGWSNTSNWAAVCDGEFYPYFPVSYTMAGFDDANGTTLKFNATGSYDTQTYTFI